MATLKPFSINADNIADLVMQINKLMDTNWSLWDRITGYEKAQTLQNPESGNQTKQPVSSSSLPADVAVSTIQQGAVTPETTNAAVVSLTGVQFQNNFPQAGQIGWNPHQLVYQGKTYKIDCGSTADKFVYWIVGHTSYSSSNSIPDVANGYQIATNNNGQAVQTWNSSSSFITAQQITAGVFIVENGIFVNSSFGGDKNGNRDGNAYFYNKDTGEILVSIGSYHPGGFASASGLYINGVFDIKGLIDLQGSFALTGGIIAHGDISGVNVKGINLEAVNNLIFDNLTSTWQSGAPTHVKYAPVLRDSAGTIYFIPVYYY